MKVRLARSEDAPAVWKTHVAAVRGLCVGDYTREQIEAWVGQTEPKDYVIPISEQWLYVAEIAETSLDSGNGIMNRSTLFMLILPSPEGELAQPCFTGWSLSCLPEEARELH